MNRELITYKKTQSELTVISQRVIEKMENNPVFPDPPTALAELKIVLPAFEAALVDAMGGDKEMTAVKNNKKAIVLDLLEELAMYVTVTCKGNRMDMLSSGFDVTSEDRIGRKLPPAIEKLEVELGPPGVATTRIRNVTGAIAFVHQYTAEPPDLKTVWVSEGWSQGSYTFEGLSSEKRHWFRVVAIGYNKQRAYSPVISRVIQ
jgi:hypothetical protein